MRTVLLALLLTGGCATGPYQGPPPAPIEIKPYVHQPYMIPTTPNKAPATVTCTTRSQPALGGPQLITTCQ